MSFQVALVTISLVANDTHENHIIGDLRAQNIDIVWCLNIQSK